MRRAELSLNVVVVAVLVLFVLVALLFIVSGKLGDFQGSAESCSLSGGTCDANCADNEIQIDAECDQGVCCGRLDIFRDDEQ